MTLFELVKSLCKSDIAAPHHCYVALACVLEVATEEHLVELEGLAVKSKTNLSDIITGGMNRFLYISCFDEVGMIS